MLSIAGSKYSWMVPLPVMVSISISGNLGVLISYSRNTFLPDIPQTRSSLTIILLKIAITRSIQVGGISVDYVIIPFHCVVSKKIIPQVTPVPFIIKAVTSVHSPGQ